jgi:putative peptidoglycan lipid II flippase
VTRQNLARAGFTVFAFFLASRVLGWGRVVVLGNLFTLDELGPFYAAFRIPDLVYQLVAAGALGSALIPVLSQLLSRGEIHRAWRVASAVANTVLVSLLAFALLMFVFAPQIVPAIVSGYGPEETQETIELTRLMLLSPIFLAMGAIVSAILNAENRFTASAIAPVTYNAAIIVVAVVLAPTLGVFAAAVGVVLGSILHFTVQLPALRHRFTWSRVIRSGDPQAREALTLMIPRAIGLGASQITFIVNTTLASMVTLTVIGAAAAVSAYNIAFNVLQIPLGIVAVPVGMVLLPSLSRSRGEDDDARFAMLVGQSIRLLLWMTVVMSAAGIVLQWQTIRVLFPGMDAPEIDATAAALAVFLLGLPAHAANVILARGFYAGRDTRTPVIVAIGSVAVNITVSLATYQSLGLQGLALGIALGGWFEAIVLTLLLHRRTPAFLLAPFARVATFVVGAVIAAAATASVVAVLSGTAAGGSGWTGAFIQLVVGSLTALAVYLVYSRLVRIPELSRAIGLARSAAGRG